MIDFHVTNLEYEEYFVVGDIHGNVSRLSDTYHSYLDKKKLKPNLRLIYLGDYLDRGLYGTEVIDLIDHIQHESKYKDDIFFLLGNHEVYKYTHTLVPNDPTSEYNNRLEYFKKRDLKFYIGYYNTKRNLIFTHGGVRNPVNVDISWIAWKDYLNNRQNDKKNKIIEEGCVELSLEESEVYVHNSLFYSFTEHGVSILEEILNENTERSKVVQIFGHWHTCLFTNGRDNFHIKYLSNIDRQHVKYIILDCSDVNQFYYLLINRKNEVEVLSSN